jgi:signal transduction histidine kinase
MWLKSANDQVRVVSEMNGIYRTQLRIASEKFSLAALKQSRSEGEFVQYLIFIFGEQLPMKILSADGRTVYRSETPLTNHKFNYWIDDGEFAGWNIQIDSVTEIPEHIIEEQRSTYRQALIATISTMMIAGGVWLVVNRGLKTDEIRKDIITTISHEIKTPVSAIKVLAESLEEGNLDEELQAEYLHLIASENERIEQLADRFLTYGRLEKQQFPVETKAVPLDPVVEKVIAMLAPGFQSANGEISVTGDRGIILLADRNGLKILLTNLVENALKYGGTPPRVLIQMSASRTNAIVSVMDNGEGIARDERKAVFRQFYRSEGRLDDGQAGVGLGLAISLRISKLMKGILTLEKSTDPEYPGAHFQFRLPLSPENIV